MTNLQSDQVFGGRYVLTDRIATGGMGDVWKARDTVLGRIVALKILSRGNEGDAGFEARFRSEAQLSARLAHPNIAGVHDYGEEEGHAWLVMEYVPGLPLSRIIRDQAPMDPSWVANILTQSAAALEAAHKASVIHRDVKPANIIVTPTGTAKLTDFGISRAVGASALTRTGEVMGTAQYLAPEQAMGRPATPQSDLYSLGVVAHEMLTGVRPYDRDSVVATAMAHVQEPVPPLPASVPQPLADLVVALMAKKPADRPADAEEVRTRLLEILELPPTGGIVSGYTREGETQSTMVVPSLGPAAAAGVPAEPFTAGVPAEPAITPSTTSVPADDWTGGFPTADETTTGGFGPMPAAGEPRPAVPVPAPARGEIHEVDRHEDEDDRRGGGLLSRLLPWLIGLLTLMIGAVALWFFTSGGDKPREQVPGPAPATSSPSESPTKAKPSRTTKEPRESATTRSEPATSAPGATQAPVPTTDAQQPAPVTTEPEPTRSRPRRTTTEPQPEPTTTQPEPQPQPTTTQPEPQPTTTQPEPEPQPTTTQPEPQPTTTQPEPQPTTPPQPTTTQPDPAPTTTEAAPSLGDGPPRRTQP